MTVLTCNGRDSRKRQAAPIWQFRRRCSDEFKELAVTEAMEPGASVSAIAHRIGIHPSQLFGLRS